MSASYSFFYLKGDFFASFFKIYSCGTQVSSLQAILSSGFHFFD